MSGGDLHFSDSSDGSGQLRMGNGWDTPAPCEQAGERLVFRDENDGSARLVFGCVDAGDVVVPPAVISADADFPAFDVAGSMRYGVRLAASAAWPDLDGAGFFSWDANASRSTLARAAPRFQQAAPLSAAARPHWQASQPLSVGHRPHWQRARIIAGAARPHWQASLPLRATARAAFQQGLPADAAVRGAFQQSIALRATTRPAFQQGLPLLPGWRLAYQQCISLRASAREREQFARPIQQAARAPLRTAMPAWHLHRPHFQQARFPPPGRTPVIIIPPEQHLCYDPARLGLLVFERAYTGDGKLVFICRRSGGGPQPGETIVVPILRSYAVINSLSLRRAADDATIAADAFALSLDDGSWTWSWSASLPLWEEGKIKPVAGQPVEVIATVNGQEFRLLAEGYRRERSFGVGRVQVQGRGRAALLDAPYAPVENRTQPTAVTAQQLALAALDINGVSSGWGLDWQLADWPIPAGTWALQATPIAAVLDVAAAAGAVVLPHRTAQTLRILPRYQVAPWDWAGVTPDIELPAAAVQVEGVEPVWRPAYDRVYVSGTTAGGILGRVTRAGQPGDVVLPMATHALVTHADAARQRGLAELGPAGRTETISLRLQVLPATGVIQPGTMLRYVDGATTRIGAVRAIALEWSRPTLRQLVTLETHPS